MPFPSEPRKISRDEFGSPEALDARSILAKSMSFPVAFEVSASNRFMKSAMSEQLCEFDKEHPEKNGMPSAELINLYRKFAGGRYGLVVSGAIMVNQDELEAPGNAIINEKIDSDERRCAFKEWARIGKEHMTLFLGQLYHPVPKSKNGNIDIGRLSKEKLDGLIGEFVYAALYAEDCGFDGVEIACAYGCTLGCLISKDLNQRKDEYGGSLEGRMWAVFRIVGEIRKHVKNNARFLVGVKLDSHNFAAGFEEVEFVDLLKKLEGHGVDYFTITGGNFALLEDLSEEKINSLSQNDRIFRDISVIMKNELQHSKLYMEGGFAAFSHMSEAITKGWAHGISLTRAAAAEPDFPHKILDEGAEGLEKPLINPSDSPAAQLAAGTQMWQHGANLGVLNPSNPEEMDKFHECVAKHQQAAENAPQSEPVVGYPKIFSDQVDPKQMV